MPSVIVLNRPDLRNPKNIRCIPTLVFADLSILQQNYFVGEGASPPVAVGWRPKDYERAPLFVISASMETVGV